MSFLCAGVLACTASTAIAQTEGRIGIGASFTTNATTDDGVGSTTTYGPLVRVNPRPGWRIAGAFNWFRADLQNPAGGSDDFAKLQVRPLMAGIGYTVGSNETVLTTFSIVAGPSFNKAEFEKSFAPAGAAIDADNSFAVRPGVGVTWTLAPRVALVGFAGYLINRPGVTYRDRNGGEFTDRWKADAVVLSIGAV